MSFTIDRRAVNRAALMIAVLSIAPVSLVHAAEREIAGTALYRERIALPETAELLVRLLDTTLADSAPSMVAETKVAPAGQVPIEFSITLDDAALRADRGYALDARVTVDGGVMFATAEPLAYEPGGVGQPIELVMVRQQGEGEALPADIVGAEWQIEEIAGFELATGAVSTLVLNENGTAGGNGGCNRFFATVTASGEAITFAEIGSTFMACDEAIMVQEQAYFEALQRVSSYRLEEGRLLLLDAEGETAITLGLMA